MTRTSARLLRIFATGLLAALPLAATLAIFGWLISLLLRFLGPNSAIGSIFVAVGLGVTGSEIVGYLLGIGLIAGAVLALGALVEAGLQRGLARGFRALLDRIPVVNTVYDFVHRMVGLFSQRDDAGMKAMSAVWCHFGGRGEGASGVAALALLSSPTAVMVGGRPCLAVLVPTAPVPVGGGLIYVPEEWVSPADVGVEGLTSIYVSMGVTSAQYLPLARPATAPAPGLAQSPAASSSP
jgi:uncharacterized membrane protein